jgi:hypothetical protein
MTESVRRPSLLRFLAWPALPVALAVALFAGCPSDVSKKDRGKLSKGLPALGKDRQEDSKADEPSTESYSRIVENAFCRVADQPLSTFSIDVDTASYSNVRRFLLTERKLPPPDAVRIEELINYFPYSYLPPKAGHPVAFTLELGSVPGTASITWLASAWRPANRVPTRPRPAISSF